MDKPRILPVSSHDMVAARTDNLIGAILVHSGKLAPGDMEKVLRLQRENGLRFGEAALRLQLLKPSDIEFALSQQFNHPFLQRGESNLSEAIVSAYDRSGAQLEAIRVLRSQLSLRWFDTDPDHKALAIVSGDRQEGRSFISANLAVAFSMLGKRTLLIDADMRHPFQHSLFGLDNRVGLSAILSSRSGLETIQRIPGLPDLSVLPAGAIPPNSIELLAQPPFIQMMKQVRQEFDLILLDSPAAAKYGDSQMIAVRAGAALIVARKNHTRMWKVRGVTSSVTEASATIVGTVFNDF